MTTPVAADTRRDSAKALFLIVFLPGVRKPHFVNCFCPNHANVYYHRYLISVPCVINRYLTMPLGVRQGTSCNWRVKGETVGEVLMGNAPFCAKKRRKTKSKQTKTS